MRQNEKQTTEAKNVALDRFFEESLCGFVITDAEGVIVFSNPILAKWSGYAVEELQGRKFADLLSMSGRIYYETHLLPTLRLRGFFDEVVVEIRSADNSSKCRVLVNAHESRDAQGELLGLHFTLIKASDRLQYEKSLQADKVNAEKALLRQTELVALREQLLAVMGHDLRNPLGAITLVADMLPSTVDDEERAYMLATLKRSSFRMNELIGNIMDFARTRLGEGMVLEWQSVSLVPVLTQVVDELSLIYPSATITTNFQLDEQVVCDPNRIAQLFSNLLANALTHGLPEEPVVVNAAISETAFRLTVSNSGNPIPDELKEHLFNPYTKESKRSSPNGLGLGLYISAEIARAHHAKLSFESGEEQTVFVLNLPLYEVPVTGTAN